MPPDTEQADQRGGSWWDAVRRPGQTFKGRVMHAGFWAFALRIAERLFGFARTVVLARLLAPEDFGLFGLALLALSTLEVFSQTGFQQALIQRRGDVRAYLDTAWTVQVVRGALLAGVLVAAAPYVAAFFDEPRATPLLRVLAASAFLQGWTNVGVVHFRKDLEFRKQFAYQFSGTLADLTVAVSAALVFRSAWALIAGLVAGSAVRAVASYVVHPYRPRLRFDRAHARGLYTFGRWVFASSIVVFLATQGDDIFLGKVLGATALGLYQVAFRISNLAATEITHVVSQVTFPAYAKLQGRPAQLRQAFLRTLEATTAVSIPVTAGLLLLAPDFVRLLLGAKWMPMVPVLQILAVSGLIRSIAATGGSLFQAVGRPQLDFWMNAARVAVMAAAIYPLTHRYGVEGTALTVVLGIAATMPFWWVVSRRVVEASRADVLRPLVPTLVGTAGMTAAVAAAQRVLGGEAGLLSGGGFVAAVALGVCVYAAFVAFFWMRYRRGPLAVVQALGGPSTN